MDRSASPSAACGVVGLKPSHGDVPTDGVIPLSASLDHVGPLAWSVQDARWIWAVMSGRDAAVIVPRARARFGFVSSSAISSRPLRRKSGTPWSAQRSSAARGRCDLTSAEVPLAASVPEIYVEHVLPEAAFWARAVLDSRGDDYTPLVRSRLQSGRAISGRKAFDAREKREDLRRQVDAALDGCDALLLPSLPIVAPPLGVADIVIDPSSGTPTPVRSAMLRQTQLFNLTGHPAIVLPVNTPGLPVGLQLVGRLNDTAGLLAWRPRVKESWRVDRVLP